MRVAARQGSEVTPGDQAVGLRAESGQNPAVGEPVEGVDRTGAAGTEDGLNGHPADERRRQRKPDDLADLAVIDP